MNAGGTKVLGSIRTEIEVNNSRRKTAGIRREEGRWERERRGVGGRQSKSEGKIPHTRVLLVRGTGRLECNRCHKQNRRQDNGGRGKNRDWARRE